MKKRILNVLIITFVLCFLSSSSFAALTWPTADGGDCVANLRTGPGTQIVDTNGEAAAINVNLSPNVGIQYNADTTAPNGEAYSLVTLNAQGNRIYGIASDFSGIKYDDFGDDVTSATIPTALDSSTAFSGWDEVGK